MNFNYFTRFCCCCLLVLMALPVVAGSLQDKKAMAGNVFTDLVNAFGNNRLPPRLEVVGYMATPENLVADYRANPTPVIRLAEKAYDVCASMGRDSLSALAVILGHELAHHYKNHAYTGSYAFSKDKTVSLGRENILNIEMDADETGIFYAYLAGYNVFSIHEKLIDKIYASYKLPEKSKGYPSKAVRKSASLQKQKELQSLLPVFDMGQTLFILKKYEEAAACFEFIINKFPSREMYYNAGVAKFMQAVLLFDKKELPFAYPLELEAKSRLTANRAINMQTDFGLVQKRNKLLAESQSYLEKARTISPEYTQVIIGLACVYDLQNNHFKAIGELNELLQSSNRVIAEAYVVRGIAYARNGQFSEAKKDLQKALEKNGLYANPNLELVKQYVQQGWTEWVWEGLSGFWTGWFDNETHHTGGKQLTNPNNEFIGSETPANLPNASIKQFSVGNWQLKLISNNASWVVTPEYDLKTVTTPPYYAGATQAGAKTGLSAAALQTLYGNPAEVVPTTMGDVYVYADCRILFVLDNAGKVRKWILYKME